MPYRDTDPRAPAVFAQHLGIATALLEQFTAISQRMRTPEELRELEREARTAWENLWAQLGEARAIAKQLGRDVEAYDAALAAGSAEAAIEALRSVMSEVVVSASPPQDLELRRGYKRIETYGPLAIICSVVAYLLWRFV